jgi:endonuclease/exonuclease/phosphatase family metal-dependent hydrolase
MSRASHRHPSRLLPLRLAALLLAAMTLACAAPRNPPGAGDTVERRAGAARTRSSNPLTVMSFNIRYGTARDGDNAWEHRRDAVVAVIESFRVHVLGVQEALHFQLEELVAALPQYRRIGVGRDDGRQAGEYAAILVDGNRIDVLEEGTFWFSDTPDAPASASWGNDIPRICTWARLREGTSGATFYLYNVHWDHVSQSSRERSAALLLETIAGRAEPGDPVLVTGDFNAGERNPAFARLLEPGAAPLTDTFREVHPEATEVGTFNGFEGTITGDKIDAVLASTHWQVLAADIVRTAYAGHYPSDHFPVVATLVLR